MTETTHGPRAPLRILLVAIPALLFILGSLGATFGWGSSIIGLVRFLPGGDVTGHVLITGALAAACVALFLPDERPRQRSRLMLIVTVLIVLTALDEGAQLYLPRRTASLTDLGANIAGITLGACAAFVILRRVTCAPAPIHDRCTCRS